MHKYLKEDELAIENYNKAIKLNPKNENAYFNLGLCAFDGERYDEAVEQFKKAVEISPEYSYGYWGLGKCYEKTDDKKQSIYYYEKFIENTTDEDLKAQAKTKIDAFYKGLVE